MTMRRTHGLTLVGLGVIALGLWMNDAPGESDVPMWTAMGESEIRGGSPTVNGVEQCWDDKEWTGMCPPNEGACGSKECWYNDGMSQWECSDTGLYVMSPGAWRDDCLLVSAGDMFCIDTAVIDCGFEDMCEPTCPGPPNASGQYFCVSDFHMGGFTHFDHYAEPMEDTPCPMGDPFE